MFIKAVPGNLARNLEALGNQSWIGTFYLAGGTACALQIGHRISRDLDFFTADEFNIPLLIKRLKALGQLETETKADDTLNGKLNGIRISFFRYPHPLIADAVAWGGVTIANLRDIGCMKLDAIQSRGKKRDFIDLWAIVRSGIPLEELFGWFEKKYAGVQYNKIHILRSLTYFVDAEADEMPEMLTAESWKDIKSFLESEVGALAHKLLDQLP